MNLAKSGSWVCVVVDGVVGGVAVIGGAVCAGCWDCGAGDVGDDDGVVIDGDLSICEDGGGSDDTLGVAADDNMGFAGSVTFALGSMTIREEKSMLLRSTSEPLLAKNGTLE
jgi:hypothetical protein